MRKTKSQAAAFAVCIDNSEYPAALELHKIYQVLPDQRAARDDFVRVVDESGEDYLYSADRFVAVSLPVQVKRSMGRQSKQLAGSAATSRHKTRSTAPARSSRASRKRKQAARRV
jgi:hypothetical protein